MNGLLDSAMAHDRSGRLDAAESGYRSLLAVEPNHERLLAHRKAVLPDPVIEVVADLEVQARRLVDSLGLEWHPNCRDFHMLNWPIRTTSLIQVRRPLFSRLTGWWKRAEAAPAPLLEAVAHHDDHQGRC